MSYKNELLGRSMFKVTDSDHIDEVLSSLNSDGYIIEKVEYHSNGRFVVQYLTRDSAEVLKTVAEHEEKEQAIIKSLVRDCSKALTNTISEDVYCKVLNRESGEVSNRLSSSFFKGVYRDIQRIERVVGCLVVILNNGDRYELTRL